MQSGTVKYACVCVHICTYVSLEGVLLDRYVWTSLCVAMYGSPEHVSVCTFECSGLFLFFALDICIDCSLGALQGQ